MSTDSGILGAGEHLMRAVRCAEELLGPAAEQRDGGRVTPLA